MFFPLEGAAAAVNDLLLQLRRLARQREFAHGLLPAQWDVLRYLAQANAMSRTPGALATYLGTTRGTISQSLMALEGKGCVARVRHARDRRVVCLELTETGRDLLQQDPQQAIRKALDDLPLELSSVLARGLRALVDRVDHGTPHSFGICRTCRHNCETDGGARVCRLSGEALAAAENTQICVSHAPQQRSA